MPVPVGEWEVVRCSVLVDRIVKARFQNKNGGVIRFVRHARISG